MRSLSTLMVLFVTGNLAIAGDSVKPPSFTKKPTAAKDGDKVKIEFAASRETDVAVSIEDSSGKTVRHLVAGMLGTNPPAPLRANSLEQSIEWDGADDFGHRVSGSGSGESGSRNPLRARVGIGTEARLGKVLFSEPGLGYSPRAVRVGPDGLVYVLSEHAQTKSTFLLQAYARDGRYVKTVMPYPANLPPERLAGLPRIRLADGQWLPLVHHPAFRDLYPESTGMRPQSLPITSRGWILLVNAAQTHNSGVRLNQRVLIVDTEGGTPTGSLLGPLTSAERRPYGLTWLALSPDEKWIYSSGQFREGGSNDALTTTPHHVVYRIDWGDKEPPKPFVGELNKPGDDRGHLNGPRGIDTDAQGHIYVCDYGNSRVAVFNADGTWAGQLDIDAPDQVAVDRKTGAVYVLTWKPPAGSGANPAAAPWFPVSNTKYNPDSVHVEQRLAKFPRLGAAATASVELGRPYCAMSIDSSGPQAAIWLARTFVERPFARRGIERVTDLGDRLSEPVEVIKPRALPDVYQVAASPVNDDVFVHSYSEGLIARADGRTGETKVLPMKGHDIAVGPQGQLLVFNMTDYFKSLARIDQYDRDGKPLAFGATGSNAVKDIPGNHWGHVYTASKGFSMSPKGDLVIVGLREKEYALWVFGPDGQFKEAAVRGVRTSDGSPVMDLAGNLYLATLPRPADEMVPKALQAAGAPPTYALMYGSVLKFGPAGGQIHYPPAGPRTTQPLATVWPPAGADAMLRLSLPKPTPVYARNALWARPGFTVAPAGPGCACYTSRFAVDYFGRVYVPDVGLFSVSVSDANNNPVLRFGDYGNEDSAGPGSKIPQPGIPLSWPYCVSVGKNGVYVSDFINRRLLRVDLVHAAEDTCAVK